jgi:hypothetical protein
MYSALKVSHPFVNRKSRHQGVYRVTTVVEQTVGLQCNRFRISGFIYGRTDSIAGQPLWAYVASLLKFRDHTQYRHNTLCRTSVDE